MVIIHTWIQAWMGTTYICSTTNRFIRNILDELQKIIKEMNEKYIVHHKSGDDYTIKKK